MMAATKVIGILQQHGDNDYSVCYPDIPENEPLLIQLLDKYADSGSSVRGNAEDISASIAKSLPLNNTRAQAHVIVYHECADNYIGIDVFTTFDAALKCWVMSLNRVLQSSGRCWIVELVRDENKKQLYFRTQNGYECFYRQEVMQKITCEVEVES